MNYRCGSCDYWEPIEDGRFQGVQARSGACKKEPPVLHFAYRKSALGDHLEEIQRVVWPIVPDTNFCSYHSRARDSWLRSFVVFVIGAWKNWLEYDPHQYGDHHAGFSRPPSFEEARRFVPETDHKNS